MGLCDDDMNVVQRQESCSASRRSSNEVHRAYVEVHGTS